MLLPDDPGTLKAMLIAERRENERLRQIIKELQRHRFGRRAESAARRSAAACAGRGRAGEAALGRERSRRRIPAERARLRRASAG